MSVYALILSLVLVVSLSGCSGIEVSKTDEILRQPLGNGGLSVGMSKTQVKVEYGDPDIKSTVSSPEWNSAREEWVYRAQYSGLPLNAGYLSEDLYLYFDGDNLTNISKRPLGVDEEEDLDADIK